MEPLSSPSPLALRGEQKPIGSTLTSPTACRVRRRVLWRKCLWLCACVCVVCGVCACVVFVRAGTVKCTFTERP